ncbi:MAG: hypothetical protein ABF479_09540 [Gluconacetobacter sp.]|uniref:Uncharacterized protein n=1 Tax=Gluconacetobacter dulcium TaxID=2729096 RepID=A0A7W4PIJ9_9PROT|nr:hypothetical protein [Gluconacetobacter dulcium]MBB2199372.1 hypothetical protein [Gluconacetobacter dulcium]
MLTTAQMATIDARHEDTLLHWLWSDWTATGPCLLCRVLTLFQGADTYLRNTPWRPDMATVLRQHGRDDFNPVPSQEAILGLLSAWPHIGKVLTADQTFNDLTASEPPADATDRFRSMRSALIQFRTALDHDLRTLELRNWLKVIGWGTVLQQAEERDQAGHALIEGRAFLPAEGGIAEVPPDRPNYAET